MSPTPPGKPLGFTANPAVNFVFGDDEMDKNIFQSKKAMMGILGLIVTTVVAVTGHGDPAYYGAIAVIMGLAIGTQGAVDFKRESQ